MKHYLLIISLILTGFNQAVSQPHFGPSLPNVSSPVDRTTGAAFNAQWFQLADRQFSPLRYNGPGGTFRIFSVIDQSYMRRHFSLGAGGDYVWNRLDFEALYLQPEITAGVTFPVDGLSTDFGVSYAGGNMTATSRIYRFINEDPDHIYWTTSYSLDFHYIFDYEIERDKKVIAVLNIPLAGAVSRSPVDRHYTFQFPGFGQYVKKIHENIGFMTVDRMQAANLKITYDLSRSRRRSLCIGYEADFARFTHPEPVIFFSNSIFLRFNIYMLRWSS